MSKPEQNQDRTFGQQLRSYLDRKGIKYSTAAIRSGFNKSRMDRIFAGADPTLEEARGLSAFLEIPIERLHDLDHFQHLAA
jgi:hypothetical protein